MEKKVPEFLIAGELAVGDVVFSAGQKYTVVTTWLKPGHMMELTLQRVDSVSIPTTKYIHQGYVFEKTT